MHLAFVVLLQGCGPRQSPALAETSFQTNRAVPTADLRSSHAPTNDPAAVAGSTLEVARAVMVTVELDFGGKPPAIADALQQVERRSQPDDGVGRTFAILDAYGGPDPEGKLHLSMHVSAEKPGKASLVFQRTGEVLWQSRIVQGTNAAAANFASKGLVILLDNGAGQTVTVDGSNHPRSVLGARVKEMGVAVGEIWPDGVEREVTFLYSACGCPVKVMAVRVEDRTARTKHLPVIFPDDPAVVKVIHRIMRWE